MWITAEGVYYQFARRVSIGSVSVGQDPRGPDHVPDSVETLTLKAALIGANPHPRSRGDSLTESRCNYFYGNEPNGWRSNVPNYRAVVLEDIYPGIDLVYYGTGGRAEYDFRVKTGADYSKIKIEYQGSTGVSVASDGTLVVTTPWGEIREQAPVVYQDAAQVRRKISSEYQINADHSFGFRLGPEFDPSLPTVIDPVLIYSTYLGGTLNDGGRGIAVDPSGAVYVTGETFSANFPTLDPYQPSRSGYLSAYVSKISRTGNVLVFSTYLGGTASDAANGIAVDRLGAVYITGFASSTDFPTVNAVDNSYNGGSYDAFVAKLSGSGDILIYSTYLGGGGWDSGDAIAVDSLGSAYVTGLTLSTDFPTQHPYQAANGGGYDAFVARYTTSGSRLSFSTYLGGKDDDDGNAIAVDTAGSAFVTGRTLSTNFPTSVFAYQSWTSGWYADAFVTRLSALGDSLYYSTYLGGAADDYGYGIAVDADGSACVTGFTKSANFPTLNAYQNALGGGDDLFVARLSGAGDALVYSTYLGGSADDIGYALALDALGNAYITGRSYSTNFPILDACQSSFQGGLADCVVAKLSSIGAPAYMTYLGGNGFDGGFGIAVDATGAAYVCGITDSDNFPTQTPYQGTRGTNGADAFVTKLSGSDSQSCCVGRVGDANGIGGDEPTIGDVSVLIDAKFISGSCVGVIPCLSEADLNQSGGSSPTCDDITIGDISILIDYLFISGPTVGLRPCL